MAYPSAIYAGTSVAGTTLVSDVDHAANHNGANSEITAIETTLGTTAGTSVLKNFVAGDFAVRINSSNVLQQAISGTVNTTVGTLSGAVIGTPSLSAGTWSNAQLIGTPQITGGTITNAALIGTSQVTGGSVSNATIGTPTFIGATNNFSYSTSTGTSGTAQAFTSIDSTNLKGTVITTNNNKIRVMLNFGNYLNNSTGNPITSFQILRGSGTIAYTVHQQPNPPLPLPIAICVLDNPSSGTQVYDVQYKVSAGTMTILSQPGYITFSAEEVRVG